MLASGDFLLALCCRRANANKLFLLSKEKVRRKQRESKEKARRK
ncbi:MAG: hypothetical protein ACOX3T_06500 [Bdellovibrionota bacterium]